MPALIPSATITDVDTERPGRAREPEPALFSKLDFKLTLVSSLAPSESARARPTGKESLRVGRAGPGRQVTRVTSQGFHGPGRTRSSTRGPRLGQPPPARVSPTLSQPGGLGFRVRARAARRRVPVTVTL